MKEILSVTQFNTVIKSFIQELGIFRVKGEITELTITSRKGVYMTLSDGKSNLNISGYAPKIKGLDMVEKDMNVIVEGVSDIYVPYGKFSLSIHSIEPEGAGALAIAYEKLKAKLKKNGLFDEENKISLPQFITKIALLTAKKSAAYSDFVKILQEKKAGIEVDFYPVTVQGQKSEKSILDAMEKLSMKQYDTIVLTRGGGSLEDLKSFNSEKIAKTIFSSKIPYIVGVGHEKDESICDFVADVRASTPSQCAYYLVNQNKKFNDKLDEKFVFIAEYLLNKKVNLFNELIKVEVNIENVLNAKITQVREKVLSFERILNSFDVATVLQRGFAIVKKKGDIVTTVNKLKKSDNIQISLQDGDLEAEVSKILN
ncbi:exodeoxyribonuclease VII large subunit [Candidatus Dojkabacteria bacterium]|nr:exodeoxyribonuclease VII large subunit [Candidatus Dojkabacteria bacterium]